MEQLQNEYHMHNWHARREKERKQIRRKFEVIMTKDFLKLMTEAKL